MEVEIILAIVGGVSALGWWLSRRSPVQALVLRAKAASKEGKYGQALAGIEDALEIAPDVPHYYWVKADVLRQLQQFDEAIVVANEGLQHNPKKKDKADLYQIRGIGYLGLEKLEEALADFDRSIELWQHAQNLIWRAMALLILNKNDEALETAEQALKKDKDNVDAQSIRATAFRNLHQYEASIDAYTQAIEANPYIFNYYFGRSLSYHALGQFEKALQDVDEALLYNPQSLAGYNQKAWILLALGRYAEARVHVEKALKLNVERAEIYDTRGYLELLEGNYDAALADFQQALALETQNNRSHTAGLAATHYKMDDVDGAIAKWHELQTLGDAPHTAESLQLRYNFAPPVYEALQEIERLANEA